MKYQALLTIWATIVTVVVAALPIAEIIVRRTPTKKDDTVLDYIKEIMDYLVPNRKSGGGTHP